MDSGSRSATNIVFNHDFSGGLCSWHPNCCEAHVASPGPHYPESLSRGGFAVITNRTESWQGLEQDIAARISAGSTYTVCAWVAISIGIQSDSNVEATLKFKRQQSDHDPEYLFIGSTSASTESWKKVEGTFELSTVPQSVIFYLHGPSPGIDILIRSIEISCTSSTQSQRGSSSSSHGDGAIILNPSFDDGLKNWSVGGCIIGLHHDMGDGGRKILPKSGKFFASARNRTNKSNCIRQDITGRVQRKLAYEVQAVVRIFSNNITSADVDATLLVQAADGRDNYTSIGSVRATVNGWVHLQGQFMFNDSQFKAVVIYLEGPPPGTDILLDNLVVKRAARPLRATPPVIENAAFGVNIIANGNLGDGTSDWLPLGNCKLSVKNGSPLDLLPMARESLGAHEPSSGRYIHVTNRTETWMGPAQMITAKVKLFLTYQVSAWVRIGNGATKPQKISVTIKVGNDQWVNCGQIESNNADKWYELVGSFRIEKKAAEVMVYLDGPDPGVNLMVAGLQIFAVDRRKRFELLKNKTGKVRKRDVILKFSASHSSTLSGTSVKVKQKQNSFPFGSCLSRSSIDNEDLVDFFTKNFTWAVFENELKWKPTEPEQGKFRYGDADKMLDMLWKRNIQVRGHCILWEGESEIQAWIQGLSKSDMKSAINKRLKDLLTRYKGKFKHYDVNNEMLHCSFYQDRLGKDIRATMFKRANELDPTATLFVNDYHIEDGHDARSSPEKYLNHIVDLREQGAPVGGIGIQGHIDFPVGPIVCSALDKLAKIGLPIWFTEIDVSSINEFVRADDLEVMLREAFAHPAVKGIMLWGFWQLLMYRKNAHLVHAEGEVNEAGKRYLALKEEWLSHANGKIDDQGQFKFRGFHGTYVVEFVTHAKKKVVKTFVVEPKPSPETLDPVVISFNL